MATFILQDVNEYSETGTILHAIRDTNEFRHTEHSIRVRSFHELTEVEDWTDCIPVGTVEFVERALALTLQLPKEQARIKPLNIPDALHKDKYLRRKVWPIAPQEDVLPIFALLNADKLFIKSASHIKTGLTGIYTPDEFKKLEVPEGELLFLSEVIPDIVSEWRCFINVTGIEDVRQYQGDPFSPMPPKAFIQDVIRDYFNDSPLAWTLDVGMDHYGTPFIIEMHPFIACGLYGFESINIPDMLKRAWHKQLGKFRKNYVTPSQTAGEGRAKT